MIPVEFSWNGGGSEVYICGNFDNWESKTPLIYRFAAYQLFLAVVVF